MFDIFYISNVKDENFFKIKSIYITVKKVDTIEEAQEKSLTKFLWVIWNDVDVEFNFDFIPDEWSQNITHVFKNDNWYDGVWLLPKDIKLSKKEIENRFIVSRKEVDLVVSKPISFDIFTIETYNDYLYALENSKTEMFWGTCSSIDTENFNFNFYFPFYDRYNRTENHAFIHRVGDKDYYNGLFLFSKHKPVTKKEIDYRHLVSRKEWDIVASTPVKYDQFNIETYDDYLYALENSKTEMFWANTPNIDTSNFDFDMYFTHDNEYDRKINHAFIHRVDDKDYYNGLFLLSKHKILSKKEIEFRHLVSRKEWDIVASTPVNYAIMNVDNYDDYLHAFKNSTTELFYAVPMQVKDIVIPNLYFTHDDEYNRKENHTFKNICNGEEKDNGVFLCSKHKPISKRELEHRHIVHKKSWDIVVSRHRPYDVVFMSYDEALADKHYEELLKKAPYATRVHGVKGIHQAHIQAAQQSTSEMLWIVDADAILLDDFNFDLFVEKWDRETVHVWRSKNPINNLVYGYGGIKLFPRQLTVNMDTSKPDMTTSITDKFKAMQEVSNITAFNVDEFSTWKSAFRECCKLASKVIDRQKSQETEQRLDIWCTIGEDKEFGKYSIAGAKAGREYGYKNQDDVEALKKINDFDWLKVYWNEYKNFKEIRID